MSPGVCVPYWLNAQELLDCPMPKEVPMCACCSVHGGAGVLMSIGLMEKIPLSFMESCMASMTGTGESSLTHR